MKERYLTPTRFEKIRDAVSASKVDAFLLNTPANVSYACGFFAPESYLVVSKQGMCLITDSRYTEDFRRKAKEPLIVKQYKNSLFKTIANTLKKGPFKKIGFESRHLSFAECQILHELTGKTKTFIPLKETIERAREIKEKGEIDNIKNALAITLKTYAHIKKMLKPGLRELDIAAQIERFIRLNGATSSAFDTIVASGPNSSYPHAGITQRPIQRGEPIVIDLGVVYNGYKCDLTRTFFLGKIKPIVQKAFGIVSEAQKRAIQAVRPGIAINKIDSAARNYISEKGFGKFFGHALGHGVGLEVHESPSISKKDRRPIKKGMVFTVEPGIYIPGSFGIRIEDMVLVTDKGAEVLSDNDSQ